MPPHLEPPSASLADIYRIAAWLLLGLTVVSLLFIGCMVALDKAGLCEGTTATVTIIIALNAVVFRKPVSKGLRAGRRVAARLTRTAADLLDPGVVV